MYPGLADSDSCVAMFRHRELVANGLRQQTVGHAGAVTGDARPHGVSIRRYVASLFVQIGRRLLDAQSVSDNSLGTTPVPPRRVVAG